MCANKANERKIESKSQKKDGKGLTVWLVQLRAWSYRPTLALLTAQSNALSYPALPAATMQHASDFF